MRRREIIVYLGGAMVAWPFAVQGRQARPARIGILHPGFPPDGMRWLAGLRQGLRQGLQDLGYVEGKNAVIETRWAERRAGRLEELAQELIDSKVDVIVIISAPALRAARKRTTTVPIVKAVSGDPIGTGTVTNLARPGGNVTGFSLMSAELSDLRLSLL